MMENNIFKIKKTHSANKTIRMPVPLIDQLQILADANEISFNQVVVQCCEFALGNTSDIITEDRYL